MKYIIPKGIGDIKENMVAIYALFDPDFPEKIRYVGKTKKNLSSRLSRHIKEAIKAKPGSNHKNDWIKSLLTKNKYPAMELLDMVPECLWEKMEKHYIKLMKTLGHKLCNLSKGGDAGNPIGYVHTDEQRKRRSGWMKNNKNANGKKSPEHIRKMILARTGIGKTVIMKSPVTMETIKKFSSMREGSKYCGHNSHATISNACHGRIKTAYGYKWEIVKKDIKVHEIS